MEKEKVKKKVSNIKEGQAKAEHFCAYQERCQQEVRTKLYDLGLWKDAVEEIISELITKGFLNEERFAISYAGGKFRIKGWGKNKIRHELAFRQLSPYCIKKGLSAIAEDDYLAMLKQHINKKSKEIKESNAWKKNNKIAQFVISKGFEPELVWEQINLMINDNCC